MKLRLSIFFSLICIFLFHEQSSFAQENKSTTVYVPFEQRFSVGEEFTYLVKYAFINLGEINTKIYAKETMEGKTIYKSLVQINSYEGLPFVNIHQDYESWFDSTLYPVYFQALLYYDKDTNYVKYFFEEDNKVHVLKGKLGKREPYRDTIITLHKKYEDGLSLLYFARYYFNKHQTIRIPCYVNEDTTSTIINYYIDKEEVEIESVDYDVDCLMLDGRTNFTGIFGLTGEFEGWFSDDVYRIPVKASLQVLIGNVKVELIHWKKKNWKPPAVKD